MVVNLCMVIAAALNTRDIHCRSLSMSAFLPLPPLLKAVERTLNKWPALIGNDNYNTVTMYNYLKV